MLGSLRLENNDFAQAGTFTNLYVISKATLDAAVSLYVNQPMQQANTGITAGATITFPVGNYPLTQRFLINGGTVGGGITAVAGLVPYCTVFFTTNAIQTFVIGATIGNALVTVVGRIYTGYSDGTKFWTSS